jgi:hypothetical protein
LGEEIAGGGDGVLRLVQFPILRRVSLRLLACFRPCRVSNDAHPLQATPLLAVRRNPTASPRWQGRPSPPPLPTLRSSRCDVLPLPASASGRQQRQTQPQRIPPFLWAVAAVPCRASAVELPPGPRRPPPSRRLSLPTVSPALIRRQPSALHFCYLCLSESIACMVAPLKCAELIV